MHASVTCTFGQTMYQEFDIPRARWDAARLKAGRSVGMGEPKHGGRLVGSRGNTKHMELHWEGVRVGSRLALWAGVFQLELESSVRPHFPPSAPVSDG